MLMRFLYRTIPGRFILQMLTQPGASKLAGCFLNSKFSKPLIEYYVKKYNIDLTNVVVPQGGFRSFNEFFMRRREEKITKEEGRLISPCDGLLTVIDIEENSIFNVKHCRFSLQSLLLNARVADRFAGGKALIFRLTPKHYHRYVYPVNGDIVKARTIPGELHTVRPVATEVLPVYVRNSREYQVIRSDEFGYMVQMEVGALLVGKISNDKNFFIDKKAVAGAEKGYFEFGGSTIILLLEKDRVKLLDELFDNRDENNEIPVKLGQEIGVKVN